MNTAEWGRTVGESIDTPEFRITAIRGSMRCLVYGLLSLVPMVGALFGVLALTQAKGIRSNLAGRWNPGARCLAVGIGLAGLGLLLFLLEFGVVVALLLKVAMAE